MNAVVEFLKNYIWKNGFDKLSENPFDVYKDMVKSDKNKHGIDHRSARLVLITLMSKTHEMAKKGCSFDELTNHIQTEHCVNRKIAKDLASMYLDLFNDENKRSWDDAEEVALRSSVKRNGM